MDDAGEYTVRAKNSYGSKEEVVFLNVISECFILLHFPKLIILIRFFCPLRSTVIVFILFFFSLRKSLTFITIFVQNISLSCSVRVKKAV